MLFRSGIRVCYSGNHEGGPAAYAFTVNLHGIEERIEMAEPGELSDDMNTFDLDRLSPRRTAEALQLIQIFVEICDEDRQAVLAYARRLHEGSRFENDDEDV